MDQADAGEDLDRVERGSGNRRGEKWRMEESEMKTSSPSEGSRQSTQEGPKGRKEEGPTVQG